MDVLDEETLDSSIISPFTRTTSENRSEILSPTVTTISNNTLPSPATILSDITFQTLDEEEVKTWTPLQRKKIVSETETLETAIGTDPCCKHDCVHQFTLDRIKAKRYSFFHLNNANKRYHLNLYRQSTSPNHSRYFIIDDKRCCIECVTRVTGVSRNLLYHISLGSRDKPINTKSSKIAIWLMDLAGYSDRMPDRDEYHIPFMNKVINQLILLIIE